MLSPDRHIDAQQGQEHRASVGRGMAPSGREHPPPGFTDALGVHTVSLLREVFRKLMSTRTQMMTRMNDSH
jgi:hypothetical protein